MSDFLYAPTHEWASVSKESDGTIIVTMGLTDYALELLMDLTYIELPSLGDETTAGEKCGEIESVKAASDINAPATGEVIEVNESLEDSLDPMTSDPFGAGWICKIKVSDESSLSSLLDEAAYRELCRVEKENGDH